MDPRKWIERSALARRAWWWLENRRTDAYFVSYPKCGRTWLRMMMGQALIAHYQIAGADPLEITTLHRHDKRVGRIRVSHDDIPQLKRPDQVERDKSKYAGKTVLLLVRDPRDTLISYYFQASKRRGRFDGTPSEFLRHDVGALDTILAYYNAWAEARHVPRQFCLVRYEDLHAQPTVELARVLGVLGHTVAPAVLTSAVEAASFDNMRKLEQAGQTGAADRLRASNQGDAESFKTRKGKVGGYRAYLTDDDIAYMEARITARLSPFYAGYLTPPDARS